jgi:hypothetical protein
MRIKYKLIGKYNNQRFSQSIRKTTKLSYIKNTYISIKPKGNASTY